jgi:predicted transcriptional regulator YdeE
MNTYTIPNNISVFGFTVPTFPTGIGEAFNKLQQLFAPADQRSYYGISVCTETGVLYNAAVEETHAGEAEKYGYDRYTIEKGDYLVETVTNWPQKLTCIKDVFAELMKDKRINTVLPCVCVEWYKNMNEMLCMIKITEQHPA